MELEMRRTSDAAPVQYEGHINWWPFCFRAYGKTWRFTIAQTVEDAVAGGDAGRALLETVVRYGTDDEASYMSHSEAESFIQGCIQNSIEDFPDLTELTGPLGAA